MLRFLTAGESHGPQLTAIVDGLPAGLSIDPDRVNLQLARRQRGYGRGGRMQIEHDTAQFLSGIRHGKTMGGPVTLVITNRDWENWQPIMDPFKIPPRQLHLRLKRLAEQTRRPRPGHADLPGGIKWDHHDLRNVLERASARETAARVAVGSLARQLLEHFGIELFSHVVRIGSVGLGRSLSAPITAKTRAAAERSEVRCIDEAIGRRMMAAIRKAKIARDSLGGVAELIVSNLPAGLGGFSQWDQRLDGRLAQALMSIHSVKGVEIGLGYAAAQQRGSAMQDEIFFTRSALAVRRKGFVRKTNNAGGLEAGITNGEPLVVRVAAKPISTLNQPLRTVNVTNKQAAEAMVERTDHCVVPALAVITEAVASLVIADAFLDKFGRDSMKEITRNFNSWLKAPY